MDIFHSGEKRDDACLHERKEMRWNIGRVSNTVTNAEKKINRYAKRFHRHGGFISASVLSCG
jgi:hypothetical protein